jgi:isoleucyl-tRNA synthetase
MRICSLGRAARSKAGIKVRQPLAEIFVGVKSDWERQALERMAPLILDELNIKEMQLGMLEQVAGKEGKSVCVVSDAIAGVAILCDITAELEAEGMAREIVHRVQTMRRSTGYDISDHIILYYEADAFIMQSLSSFADYIKQEILADDIEDSIPDDVDLKEEFKVSGYKLLLGIKKVA